jgi:hypothetical protein
MTPRRDTAGQSQERMKPGIHEALKSDLSTNFFAHADVFLKREIFLWVTSPAGFRKIANASLAQRNCGRSRGCAVPA